MGIQDALYDFWNDVESHYDSSCTYDIIEIIPNNIKTWRRNCRCRRNLPAIIVVKSYDTDLRQETRYGVGGRWYELIWIKYDRGSTGHVRYVRCIGSSRHLIKLNNYFYF